MRQPVRGFDAYFERWCDDVCRLCLILCPDARAAREAAFQAFLRLAGAKDSQIGEADARALLFSSALRICDDFYLKRLRRRPRRQALAAAFPCPVTDALYAVLRLPFPRRAALALSSCGFTHEEIARMLRAIGRVPPRAARDEAIPGWREALAAVCVGEEEARLLCDRIYDRFTERSVPVENAIHNARSAFDRAAPLLALLVLALFAAALYVTRPA